MADATRRGYVTWEEANARMAAGETIHAAAGPPPANALCGLTTDGPLSLDLSHADAREWRHTVNCAGCLEWLHA